MFDRLFGKKELARSHQEERTMLTALANQAAAQFEQRKSELESGAITATKLVHEILTALESDVELLVAQPLSNETKEKLIAKYNVVKENSDRAMTRAYLRAKLMTLAEVAKPQAAVESEGNESINEEVRAADAYEQGQPVDLSAHLATRPNQHNIFEQSTIIGGVYPNTESSPAILVDDAVERGAELKETYDEFVKSLNSNTEYQKYAKQGIALIKNSFVETLVVQFVREKLPLDTGKPSFSPRDKQTLQNFLYEGKGTPTAQTLLTGYLLESLQQNKVLPHESFQIKRTKSETGGHAYLQTDKRSVIFDPAVLDDPVLGGKSGEFSHPSYS